jgi:hypothetical protein
LGDFLKTLYGKVIATLTIIALLLGIATEGVSFFRIVMETKTSTETAINAQAQKRYAFGLGRLAAQGCINDTCPQWAVTA